MTISVSGKLLAIRQPSWLAARKAIQRYDARRCSNRLLTLAPSGPWPIQRADIESLAGQDFLAAGRGGDFAWFGPLERQATTILCRFFQVDDSELRLRRAEALGRALDVLRDGEMPTHASVIAEHKCGPRECHRADIVAFLETSQRKITLVIEAKFQHDARNPWRSYETLGQRADDWRGFIVAPQLTSEIAAVARKRSRDWIFISWKKLLRGLSHHLQGIDDEDFRRFRATLLRRAEGFRA